MVTMHSFTLLTSPGSIPPTLLTSFISSNFLLIAGLEQWASNYCPELCWTLHLWPQFRPQCSVSVLYDCWWELAHYYLFECKLHCSGGELVQWGHWIWLLHWFVYWYLRPLHPGLWDSLSLRWHQLHAITTYRLLYCCRLQFGFIFFSNPGSLLWKMERAWDYKTTTCS